MANMRCPADYELQNAYRYADWARPYESGISNRGLMDRAETILARVSKSIMEKLRSEFGEDWHEKLRDEPRDIFAPMLYTDTFFSPLRADGSVRRALRDADRPESERSTGGVV